MPVGIFIAGVLKSSVRLCGPHADALHTALIDWLREQMEREGADSLRVLR